MMQNTTIILKEPYNNGNITYDKIFMVQLDLGEINIMDKWMSMKQLCAYLGISRDTATKWINNKSMPAHRIDRIWRFDKDEIDEWMKNNGKNASIS